MKFGVREICDVVFKTTASGQVVAGTTYSTPNMPCLYIDTAKTSTLEGGATTVYAQGGKGNVRLLAWEGEKTLTFTVEDAVLSPEGFAVLAGAMKAADGGPQHVVAEIKPVSATSGKVTYENIGISSGISQYATSASVATLYDAYATEVDSAGAYIKSLGKVTWTNTTIGVSSGAGFTFASMTSSGSNNVLLDFYITRTGINQLLIDAENFGGYFYVEASTLFRDQNTAADYPAEIIIPKAKVQSNFTFNLASTGDPSTFSFVMDAFPAPTKYDSTKKVLCAIQIAQ